MPFLAMRFIALTSARFIFIWALLWSLVFALLHAVSPDPVTTIAGILADQETRIHLAARFGLGESPVSYYLHGLFRALTFDFGDSWRSGRPVAELLHAPLLISSQIALAAAVAAALASVAAFGVAPVFGPRAIRRIAVVSSALSGLPGFLIALLLALGPLPGMLGLPAHGLPENNPAALLLPSLCVLLPLFNYGVLRGIATFKEASESLWFRFGLAQGGTRASLALCLGWPRLMRCAIDTFANAYMLGLTGAVGVEYVMGIPGLGTAMMDAIQVSDNPVILAVVGIAGATAISLVLVRELLEMMLDHL